MSTFALFCVFFLFVCLGDIDTRLIALGVGKRVLAAEAASKPHAVNGIAMPATIGVSEMPSAITETTSPTNHRIFSKTPNTRPSATEPIRPGSGGAVRSNTGLLLDQSACVFSSIS